MFLILLLLLYTLQLRQHKGDPIKNAFNAEIRADVDKGLRFIICS